MCNVGMNFRNNLLAKKKRFKKKFIKLQEEGLIKDFSSEMFDIIKKDLTPINLNGKQLKFYNIFKKNLNNGRCRQCAIELCFLMDKLGYRIKLIQGKNMFFKKTAGSFFGGHHWVEAEIDGVTTVIDTSLMIMTDKDTIKELGHEIIYEKNIDNLCSNPELLDYYETMILE